MFRAPWPHCLRAMRGASRHQLAGREVAAAAFRLGGRWHLQHLGAPGGLGAWTPLGAGFAGCRLGSASGRGSGGGVAFSTDASPPPEATEKPADLAEKEKKGKPAEKDPSFIKMPEITDGDKFGDLTSWSVSVGDFVKTGDVVCEVELEQFSVGVKIDDTGYVAELLVPAGAKEVPVGAHMAVLVPTEEGVRAHAEQRERERAAKREAEEEAKAKEEQEQQQRDQAEGQQERGKGAVVEPSGFTWKDVMKSVRQLMDEGRLEDGEASTLLSLVRARDAELMSAFDGSFEGDSFADAELDVDFFLVQARDIARERRGKEGDDLSAD